MYISTFSPRPASLQERAAPSRRIHAPQSAHSLLTLVLQRTSTPGLRPFFAFSLTSVLSSISPLTLVPHQSFTSHIHPAALFNSLFSSTARIPPCDRWSRKLAIALAPCVLRMVGVLVVRALFKTTNDPNCAQQARLKLSCCFFSDSYNATDCIVCSGSSG